MPKGKCAPQNKTAAGGDEDSQQHGGRKRRNTPARREQNAEAQRRYRNRLKSEKSVLQDLAASLTRRIDELEDSNSKIIDRMEQIDSVSGTYGWDVAAVRTTAEPAHKVFAAAAEQQPDQPIRASGYALDMGETLQKSWTQKKSHDALMYMSLKSDPDIKLRVARLRALVAAAPASGSPDITLASRIAVEVREYVSLKHDQRRVAMKRFGAPRKLTRKLTWIDLLLHQVWHH